MRPFLFITLFLVISGVVSGQPNIPVNGPKQAPLHHVAFVHATLYTDYQTIVSDATLIIKDGKVVYAGKATSLTPEIQVVDCKGKFIYPGFIDLYTDFGIQFKTEKREWNENQLLTSKQGAYSWNEAIRSEVNAAELFRYDEAKAKQLRDMGITAVVTGLQDGICRGTSALVFTASGREQEMMLKEKMMAGYSFSKGTSSQPYPSSLAGVIALLRQTYYDARWYKTQTGEKNISLEAFNQIQNLPAIFQVDNKLDILRADRIAKEFNTSYVYKGAGDEYQRIEEIKSIHPALIIPVNFPKPNDVENPLDASRLSTADLKHWELAPANPARLKEAGIEFAITSKGCENAAEFMKNLKKALAFGLKESDLLKSLTYVPSKILKMEDQLGSLKTGMYANLIITDGKLFDKPTQVLECWSKGERYVVNTGTQLSLLGEYTINAGVYQKLKISGSAKKMQVALMGNDTLKGSIATDAGMFLLSFKKKDLYVTSTCWVNQIDSGTYPYQAKSIQGKLHTSDSADIFYEAILIKTVKPDTIKEDTIKPIVLGKVVYPFTDFGWNVKPKQETVLFRNATIWTNESDSILLQTDLLVADGKIKAIGKGLKANGAKEIDATGKYLTSGIIDEHSHIALTRGVNEGTQAVTAEVRMGDAISSEDIDIYRQLSGGVVASQLLHGSANPIGGQSALIKLRWGAGPEQMKIEDADGFIKFALGENVKQSNWGDRATFRYPQTRMGVEQIDIDAFTRARSYQQKKKGHVDLELEALSEILNHQRFITCHSYVQSEINMLMHVADSFHFNINTFTHILEGYKVADKMKKHGVGASTFADWWAYKYEVIEAIPYNAAILNKMGVVTAINSDDAEMGRRLNQEAAKTIKYGGVSEMDAWKMVTLNPAKLLHLDQHMGSIKQGKDADVVLWSDNPLSVYAKVLYTYVDGTCYFDFENDVKSREEIKKERERIIQKMLAERANGEKTEKKISVMPEMYHCETELDYGK